MFLKLCKVKRETFLRRYFHTSNVFTRFLCQIGTKASLRSHGLLSQPKLKIPFNLILSDLESLLPLIYLSHIFDVTVEKELIPFFNIVDFEKRWTMPYVLVRESFINSYCCVEGLPLNEGKILGKWSVPQYVSCLFYTVLCNRSEGITHSFICFLLLSAFYHPVLYCCNSQQQTNKLN